jgi:small subunit ribosomal protein S3
MGQKVNPIGLRLGINRTSDSRWYADSADYGRLLHEDIAIRKEIRKRLKQAGISKIIIERPHKKCLITIHTARPGLVIGKKGGDIETLRKDLSKMTEDEVRVNLVEIRKPEIDATLIADDIARQLERRASFRRTMKRAIQSAMRLGADGVKIMVCRPSGRRRDRAYRKYAEGSVPLHTLRADIDYGTAEAETTYGIIGIKVWVYKGEILEHDPMAQDKRLESSGQSRARANANQRGPATGAQTAGA